MDLEDATMNAMALEAQKAGLAREILSMEDESIIRDMWLFLKQWKPAADQQRKTLGDFSGILPEIEYHQLREHATRARKEWNRDF